MIKHALIMAAGRGNRMKPLTNVIPKALAPYKGNTLIGHSISGLRASGLSVHVTVGHLGSLLAETLIREGLVDSVINTTGHDNAWWIFNSLLKELDEPILLLTCDNVTDLKINELEAEYEQLSCPPCMLVPVAPIEGVDGDFIEHDNGIVKNISRTNPTTGYASGIQIINPAAVNRVVAPTEVFSSVWTQLMEQKLLGAANIYKHSWFSIDTLTQLIERNDG